MGKLQGIAEIEAPILVLFQKLRDNGINIDLSLLDEALDKRNLHIVDLDFLAEEISVKTRGNPVIGLAQVGQAYSSAVMEATKTREGINDAIERGIKIQSGKLNKSPEIALKVFAEVRPDIDFSKLQAAHGLNRQYVELHTREKIIAKLVDGLFKIADGLSSKERIVKQYNDNFVHIQHSISDNPSFLELSASEQNPKPHNVKHYTKHKMHFIKGKGFNIQNDDDDVRFEIKSVADLKAIRHVKLQESIAALEAKHGDDRSIEKLASLIRAGGSMTFGEVIASVNALKLEPAARKKVNQSVDSNIATHMQSAEDGLSNAESHVNKALEMRTTQQPGQKNVLQKSKSVNIINTDNKATAQDMSKNTLQKSKSMDDMSKVKVDKEWLEGLGQCASLVSSGDKAKVDQAKAHIENALKAVDQMMDATVLKSDLEGVRNAICNPQDKNKADRAEFCKVDWSKSFRFAEITSYEGGLAMTADCGCCDWLKAKWANLKTWLSGGQATNMPLLLNNNQMQPLLQQNQQQEVQLMQQEHNPKAVAIVYLSRPIYTDAKVFDLTKSDHTYVTLATINDADKVIDKFGAQENSAAISNYNGMMNKVKADQCAFTDETLLSSDQAKEITKLVIHGHGGCGKSTVARIPAVIIKEDVKKEKKIAEKVKEDNSVRIDIEHIVNQFANVQNIYLTSCGGCSVGEKLKAKFAPNKKWYCLEQKKLQKKSLNTLCRQSTALFGHQRYMLEGNI